MTDHSTYLPISNPSCLDNNTITDTVAVANSTKLRASTCTLRRPWIVFMAGGMGVGKSYVLKWASSNGYFDASRYVHVDPDKIKFMLPEMQEYIRRNNKTAGSLTHKESGYIAEIVQVSSLTFRLLPLFYYLLSLTVYMFHLSSLISLLLHKPFPKSLEKH